MTVLIYRELTVFDDFRDYDAVLLLLFWLGRYRQTQASSSGGLK